ncbi:MAG: hypothetical protein IKT07_03215, partial [Oscillospiraceae bacterium]|nr:hypothetical protein [Oscillospiraceae bacterium]
MIEYSKTGKYQKRKTGSKKEKQEEIRKAMKKRLLALLLCLLMCASLMPITALADGTITAAEDDGSITVAPAEEENAGDVDITPIWDESMYEKPENSDLDEEGEKADVFLASSGACGDNLTWTLNDNGKLTISGTGDMDGGGPDSYPWAENSEGIKTIVISSGVTSIG